MATIPIDLSDPYGVPLESIDMSDPSIYERNEALAYFERLRKESPVHFSEGSDCGPFWSVTKFDDIIQVDKNHRVFSADSSHGGHLLGYGIWFKSDPYLQTFVTLSYTSEEYSDTQISELGAMRF